MAPRSLVHRIVAVLEACLASTEPLALAELARATGLPKPTAWRLAESLTARGLLARTPGGYLGGSALAVWGERAARQARIREIVVPELLELHQLTRAPVWAVDVSDDRGWVVIGQVYDREAVQRGYSEGWLHDPKDPAILAGALGLVALHQRPELVDGLLRRGIPRVTPDTEVRPARVLAHLGTVADAGHAIEHGRVWRGWSCLAVPVVEPVNGLTVAVLGVVDRTPRFVATRFVVASHRAAHRTQAQWRRPSGTPVPGVRTPAPDAARDGFSGGPPAARPSWS